MNLNRLAGFALKFTFKLDDALLTFEKQARDLGHQLRENMVQDLAIGGGVFQLCLGHELRRRAMRDNRFRDRSERLIEANEQLRVESRSQVIARQDQELRDLLNSEFGED